MLDRLDWNVRKDSRIAGLPAPPRALALIARNFDKKNWRETLESFPHRSDQMATRHNVGFMREPRFEKAYACAVKASGWDYGLPFRAHQILWCSQQAQKVKGDYIELGTARGFMMSAVLAAFPDWEKSQRTMHLFDTFKSAFTVNGKQADDGPANRTYAKSADVTRDNFSEWPRVELHVGDVFETLPLLTSESIAFVHIDLNYDKPEIFALRTLWDRIPRGGVIVLDDYAYKGYTEQYDAMNALSRELGFDILTTPTGQGLILK
jgi:hypothetical protein